MAIPNPSERRIFMDKGKVCCDRCVNKEKHGNEEPCCSCKWLTGSMSDIDFYKKVEEKSND